MAKRNLGTHVVGGRHMIYKDGKSITETRQGTVELEIDIPALVKALGFKALFTKSGKAVAMKGAVTVRVIGDVTKTEGN